MIIDFSAHYLTPQVEKILDEAGREPWPAEKFTIEDRLKTMSKYGVDMQVLSLTTPYLLGINPKNAAKACKASNDSIQKVIEKYPDKFTGFAVISLLDVDSALEELESNQRSGLKRHRPRNQPERRRTRFTGIHAFLRSRGKI